MVDGFDQQLCINSSKTRLWC